MSTNELRKFEMLVRVGTFGDTHSTLFPATSVGGQAFRSLKGAVGQLHEHAVLKQTTAKGGRKARRVARESLLAQLEAISRSARGIGVSSPGFEDAFQMSPSRTDAAYATTGRTFLRESERVKEMFMRYDMPDDFIAQLTASLEEFEKTCREQRVNLETLRAARSSIEQALEAGLAAVQTLDTVVPNRLSRDPVTRSVWEQSRRVDYSRRTRRVTATAPPAPPTDVAVPVATAAHDAAPNPALGQAS